MGQLKIKDAIKENIIKNKYLAAFILLFFIYFTSGLTLCFFNDVIFNNIDVVLDTDTMRVYHDFIYVGGNHNRINVHPFQLLEIQPLVLFFNTFLHSQRASVLAVLAFGGSVSVLALYFACLNFTNKKDASTLICLIYGFSFSVLFFSSIPEVYIFGGCFISLFICYISILYKNQKPLTYKNLFILAFLIILGFGINIPIAFSDFILLLWLIIKLNKNNKKAISNTLVALGMIIVLWIGFSLMQKLAYTTSPAFLKNVRQESRWLMKRMHNPEEIRRTASGIFVRSFYSTQLHNIQNTKGEIEHVEIIFYWYQKITRQLPAIIFFVITIFIWMFNYKKYQNKDLMLALTLIFLINIFENFLYYPCNSFLFSQNFLPYLIVLMGLIYSKIPKKILYIVLLSFLGYQIITNPSKLAYIARYISAGGKSHIFNFLIFILCSFVTSIFFGFICFIYNKFLNKNIKYFDIQRNFEMHLWLYFAFITISLIFTIFYKGIV